MAAYLIVEVAVEDPEVYDEYRSLVPASLAAYQGSFLVRGGAVEPLEGDWDPERIVVIRFENAQQAKRWWSSDEYRDAKALRQRAARTRMIVVDGVE
jgi:uncharacterized protein (DUF1330 family)